MLLRLAAVCGLLVPVTYAAALLFGAGPARGFRNADDAISDLGAGTATSTWLYNQLGTNLTGLLMIVFALGLWRALSPDLVGRLGAGLLVLQGINLFLEGFFPLDCQGIDANCDNTSWQADGHRWVSRFTGAFLFIAQIVLAFAFRRIPGGGTHGCRPSPSCRCSSPPARSFPSSGLVHQPVREPSPGSSGSASWLFACSRRPQTTANRTETSSVRAREQSA